MTKRPNSSNIYNEFYLTPSYLKWLFHGIAWLILQFLLYHLLDTAWWFITLLISSLCSFLFIKKQSNIIYFGHLDAQDWTLIENSQQKKPQRIEIINMIDHIFYIVVFYKNETKQSNFMIWQDQTDIQTWKALKTRSQFKQFH